MGNRGEEETAALLAVVGGHVRELRLEQGLTLQGLGERTGLSPAMLSLLERGKTAPSLGTLVVLAQALGVQPGDLLASPDGAPETVSRAAGRPVQAVAAGVFRRILRQDRLRGLALTLEDYQPGSASEPAPGGSEGFEYGLVLAGRLEVLLEERRHLLGDGDLIAYPSGQPHRIGNPGPELARAVWVRLRRG